MADIELVIKISEDSYKATCKGFMLPLDVENVVNAIKTGTPLPKGHGRLIDADDIDNHIIGHVDTRSCPTIIEADKAEKEHEA